MLRSNVLPIILLVLGTLITLYNLAGGLHFSFPLLLGLLLLADGVLRLLTGGKESTQRVEGVSTETNARQVSDR